VLVWARETAGVSVDEAARRIGVKPERVAEWEAGRASPTLVQLRHAAEAYNRPLGALLLPAPIPAEERLDLPDFRRPSLEGEESPILRRAILRAQRQRDALQEVVDEGTELALPRTDVVQINGADAETAGAQLRAALELDDVKPAVRRNPMEMVRDLVRRIERRGYLVIQVQRVPIAEMRGFSLAGGLVPVIALNGADWPRGKVYTLLHEMAHIGLRHSSLCDLSRQSSAPEERYCDAVAAAALMPARAFRAFAQGVDPRDYMSLRSLADGFGVSAESALIRMIHLGTASWDDYNEMRDEFRSAYETFKRDEKEAGEGKDKPIYYQLKLRDLGRPFVASVLRAHDDGALSSRDTAVLLDVTYDKIGRLASMVASDEIVA
jgi:Zn-dependent peptidase ImmA (M78 family)/DNA-binding XRE family transcriptional regulator